MSAEENGEAPPEINEKTLKLTDNLTNGMLRDYIADLEQQKTKLLLSLKEYKQKYEQQKNDQSDIYFYLNKKLDENYETIAALEEQILSEQADRESQERLLEKRIHTLEMEAVAMEAKYLGKLNEAEEKLNKLKDFGENKDELDRNLQKLLVTLEEERKQFRAITDEMDRRGVQERERIKKDCARQFEEYKESLQADADQKLSAKTKKTQEMNAMIKSELSYQSKQADHVLVYNQKVMERDRDLRQQLELSQTTQTEMVNRLALYQRLIKQLNERVVAEEAQSTETIRVLQKQCDSKDYEMHLLTTQLEDLKSKLQNELDQQRNVWTFLANKYKKLTSHAMKNGSVDSFTDPDDKILVQLISLVLQKHPDRFPSTQGKHRQKTTDHGQGGVTLPQIFKKSNVSEFELSSSTTTGIYTWDNARSSPRDKWWSSSTEDVQLSQVGNTFLRSVAIQTDGYVLPYPPDSSWLKKKTYDLDTSQELLEPPLSVGSQERNEMSTEDMKSNTAELTDSNSNLAEIIDEMNKTNTNTIPVADPLSKKRPSRKNLSLNQSPAVTGRSRLVKKVYVDPNSFMRDEDINDSLSTLETSSHPSLFSVSGKSISGRVSNKQKPQSKMSIRRPHPPNSGEGRHLSETMDDNSVISNITLSPRTSSC